jgi:hypothetical protein
MLRSETAVAGFALGLAVCVASAGCPAQAQQFAADLISSNVAGETVGKPGRLYVAERKVRIETPDLPDSFFIVDSAIPAAYLVRPAQRVYMDAKQSSRLSRLFVSLDPADPCPQWQAMAEVAGIAQTGRWHCEAEGADNVDGRPATKFQMLSPLGHSIGWIDAQLRFPIQIETENGSTFALRNIAETPQPAEMFEIPTDYRKFDPQQIIEFLKHTDIWVEPSR